MALRSFQGKSFGHSENIRLMKWMHRIPLGFAYNYSCFWKHFDAIRVMLVFSVIFYSLADLLNHFRAGCADFPAESIFNPRIVFASSYQIACTSFKIFR
jgi:hypothetical protein